MHLLFMAKKSKIRRDRFSAREIVEQNISVNHSFVTIKNNNLKLEDI